ncbi:EamA family transporter RarD [Tolumonas osonensis]|uniref:Chloramphenicol-sensitive protein RarD n=1 Tax=Tolumonas osonensis TaxID=675874 RepID=A0A841GPI7_9GAMM|nr:EamA family transporter RarD [Tolumonas osonensis]MBB6056422.1 chloramphenicol-sensitive protein RarD [Tolumonas osonensis]
MKSSTQGMLYALTAFFIWGVAPLYFKHIGFVPAGEIVTHRIIWSCVFLILLVWWTKSGRAVLAVFRHPRYLALLTLTAVLIAANWLLFIWAINHDHMLESSLGYFINPLLNILLGMLFLGERLRQWQWFAVALAVSGVVLQIVTLGVFPWIALALAGSFAVYGLLRKKMAVDSLTGLLVETLVLTPVAAWYLFLYADSATSQLSQNTLALNLWLIAAGIITTVPLLCFTAGAKRLRLSTIGFFQYIGPSLMFIFAITLYHEPIVWQKWLTFALIWSALVVFSWDALRHTQQN